MPVLMAAVNWEGACIGWDGVAVELDVLAGAGLGWAGVCV